MLQKLIRRLRQRRYGKSYCTMVGWYYLGLLGAIFAAAILREINLLMVLAGLMIGPFLYSYFGNRLKKDWFAIQRRFPESVHANDPFSLQINLTNQSVYTLFALVVRQKVVLTNPLDKKLSVNDEDERTWWAGFLFCQILPGNKQTESVQASFQLPGQYQLPPVEIHTRFPLGLFECRVKLGKTQTFWVYPALGELLRPISRWEAFCWESAVFGGRRLSPQDGEFHSVAPWRNGESQRRIHWRSSARRGELIVKRFQTPLSGKLAIWIDLSVPENFQPGNDTTSVKNGQNNIPAANQPEYRGVSTGGVSTGGVSAGTISTGGISTGGVLTPAEEEFQRKASLAATILYECCVRGREQFPEGLQITLACLGISRLGCVGRNDAEFYHRALKILSTARPIYPEMSPDTETGLETGLGLPNDLTVDTRILIISSNEALKSALPANRTKFIQIIKTDVKSLESWFRDGKIEKQEKQ